jgi:hypothetical protein
MGGVREARTRKPRLMAPTTNWADCQRFATAVSGAGGELPPPLQHLLLPAASAAAAAQVYRLELARSSEHTLLGEWHRQVKAGCADEILISLRKNFDRHVEAIDHARTLIDPESSPEQILASAAPEMIAAWQGLDQHIKAITRIAAVASQFARCTAIFPQVQEYHLADNGRVDDRALACTDGPPLRDSALFGRPDQGHRSSPFFRLPLRLHTIAEMHENPVPENPYRQKVST